MPKGVTISARISQEDAEFISQLSIDGAVTPSDKVRAIIADAKRHALGKNDYLSTVQQLKDLVAPNIRHIREAEYEHDMHSELIAELYETLPDLLAFLVAGTNKDMDSDSLTGLEKKSAVRLFSLIEKLLYIKARKSTVGYQREHIDDLVSDIAGLARQLE